MKLRVGTAGSMILAGLLSLFLLAETTVTPRAQGSYDWWRGERAKRTAALQGYLAAHDKEFQSFKSAPMASKQGLSNPVGVPMVMFRLFPEIFPDIWGPPQEKMLRLGWGPDPWAPDNVMPLGFGYLPSKGFTIPLIGDKITVNYATLSCAGCHAGAVTGPDSKLIRMIGAPTAVANIFDLLERTVNDPRYTADNFKTALKSKPVGWVYGDPAMASQEQRERELFNLPGGADFFTKELALFANGFTKRMKETVGTYTYSGANVPPIGGGIPGMFDVMSAGAAGGAKPDRMTVAELEAALPKAPGPSDVPAAWMQANRAGFQWDNSIERVVAREAGASLSVSGGDPLAINMENIALAGAFVEHLPSAPYPFDVDSEKAARGKLLFDAACQSCHQPRNPGVMGPAETGTDPNRVLAVTDFALTTLTTEVREGCKIPACYAKDGSALPDVDIWKMTGGYASLPLDGAWATAPYLHNGSVPTLKQLLTGDRPDKFYRGNTTYDQDIVGFTWDKATNPDAVVYDTSLAGFSNTGHTGAQFNGRINWASAPDKLADLLEYLKTL